MFAFREANQFTVGRARPVGDQVPLGKYLGAMAGAGYIDSLHNALSEFGEDLLAGPDSEADLVDPESLNKRHGIPGHLKFEEPMTDRHAALLKQRKEAEIERMKLMQQLRGGGALRSVAGFGAAVIGNIVNPVDAGFSVLPIFGSAASATKVLRGGAVPIRAGMMGPVKPNLLRRAGARFERGLVAEERFATVPLHKVLASATDATIGNMIVEVPVFMQKIASQADYTVYDALLNVAGGAVFGGGVRGIAELINAAALKSSRRAIDMMSQEGKLAAAQLAARDFLEGKQLGADRAILLDEQFIREGIKAKWDYDAVKARAESEIGPIERSIIVEKARQDTIARVERELANLPGPEQTARARGAIAEFVKEPSFERALTARAFSEQAGVKVDPKIEARLSEAEEGLTREKARSVNFSRLRRELNKTEQELAKVQKRLDEIEAQRGLQEENIRAGETVDARDVRRIDAEENTLEDMKLDLEREVARIEYELEGGRPTDHTMTPELQRLVGEERERRIKAFIDEERYEVENGLIREYAEHEGINPRLNTPEEAAQWEIKPGESPKALDEQVDSLMADVKVSDAELEEYRIGTKTPEFKNESRAIDAAANCILGNVKDI